MYGYIQVGVGEPTNMMLLDQKYMYYAFMLIVRAHTK